MPAGAASVTPRGSTCVVADRTVGAGAVRPGAPFRVWYARRPPRSDGEVTLAAIAGDLHPDRAIVDIGDGTAGDRAEASGRRLYRARYQDGWMTQVTVESDLAPAAPTLWYLEVGEPDAEPAAMTLVAFATDHFADGTVMAAAKLSEMGLGAEDRAGVLRWWVETGQVHQIYVAARARRQGVGTKLALACAAYCRGPGWPSLWGNGQVTDLGEAWIDQAVWRGRVEGQSERMPPMTPDHEAAGVPDRNLFPDPS